MIETLEAKDLPVPGFNDSMAALFEPRQRKGVHWSVPWSDLMMTMFILFAVLFAYHVSEQGRFAIQNITTDVDFDASRTQKRDWDNPSPVNPPPDMSKLFQISKQTLNTEHLQGLASVKMSKDGAVMIVLTSDVLFDSGRAELKPQNIRPLQKVAGILYGTPYILNIIGHTDNIAINNQQFSSNWELSTARACVTARYLIEEMGISPSRIYAAGHAEYDPINSNRTREGRAANRRVEIVITREKPYLNSDRQFDERWGEK
jgi:chemotaxis protein MotB